MITRGDVSLDVEDHRGPDDWPSTSDITSDMLMYSVHLPVDPKQNNSWPAGGQIPEYNEGAVRILNIVVDEARVLASRERCPYLVRVEVADTNLRGNDSRLYASGAPGLGATMEEALTMSTASIDQEGENGNYQIPSELFAPSSDGSDTPQTIAADKTELLEDAKPKQMPRGGWQEPEPAYYSHSPENVYATNTYDAVRENQYEQLHHQMYNDAGMVSQPPQPMTAERYVTTSLF